MWIHRKELCQLFSGKEVWTKQGGCLHSRLVQGLRCWIFDTLERKEKWKHPRSSHVSTSLLITMAPDEIPFISNNLLYLQIQQHSEFGLINVHVS